MYTIQRSQVYKYKFYNKNIYKKTTRTNKKLEIIVKLAYKVASQCFTPLLHFSVDLDKVIELRYLMVWMLIYYFEKLT